MDSSPAHKKQKTDQIADDGCTMPDGSDYSEWEVTGQHPLSPELFARIDFDGESAVDEAKRLSVPNHTNLLDALFPPFFPPPPLPANPSTNTSVTINDMNLGDTDATGKTSPAADTFTTTFKTSPAVNLPQKRKYVPIPPRKKKLVRPKNSNHARDKFLTLMKKRFTYVRCPEIEDHLCDKHGHGEDFNYTVWWLVVGPGESDRKVRIREALNNNPATLGKETREVSYHCLSQVTKYTSDVKSLPDEFPAPGCFQRHFWKPVKPVKTVKPEVATPPPKPKPIPKHVGKPTQVGKPAQVGKPTQVGKPAQVGKPTSLSFKPMASFASLQPRRGFPQIKTPQPLLYSCGPSVSLSDKEHKSHPESQTAQLGLESASLSFAAACVLRCSIGISPSVLSTSGSPADQLPWPHYTTAFPKLVMASPVPVFPPVMLCHDDDLAFLTKTSVSNYHNSVPNIWPIYHRGVSSPALLPVEPSFHMYAPVKDYLQSLIRSDQLQALGWMVQSLSVISNPASYVTYRMSQLTDERVAISMVTEPADVERVAEQGMSFLVHPQLDGLPVVSRPDYLLDGLVVCDDVYLLVGRCLMSDNYVTGDPIQTKTGPFRRSTWVNDASNPQVASVSNPSWVYMDFCVHLHKVGTPLALSKIVPSFVV
jgi:hypothetical protein